MAEYVEPLTGKEEISPHTCHLAVNSNRWLLTTLLGGGGGGGGPRLEQ